MEDLDETTAKTLSKNKIKNFLIENLLSQVGLATQNFLEDYQISENFLGRGGMILRLLT